MRKRDSESSKLAGNSNNSFVEKNEPLWKSLPRHNRMVDFIDYALCYWMCWIRQKLYDRTLRKLKMIWKEKKTRFNNWEAVRRTDGLEVKIWIISIVESWQISARIWNKRPELLESVIGDNVKIGSDVTILRNFSQKISSCIVSPPASFWQVEMSGGETYQGGQGLSCDVWRSCEYFIRIGRFNYPKKN